MFGGRIYETLPMQVCKQSTAEEQNRQIEVFCTCQTQEGCEVGLVVDMLSFEFYFGLVLG